jgi:hypothetical protein
MKPLAKSVMFSVAGLLLAALFATAAPTNGEPPLHWQPFLAGSTNLTLEPLSSAPIVYLDGKMQHSQQLAPGIYQTRPYTMILVVPGAEHDDCCVNGGINGNSKMPNAKPGVQAVPKTLLK